MLKRGSCNQSLRKVKGHATKEDIQKGISNEKDKEGNDKSDKLADEGVENIQGRGLVKLASWIANRHYKYGAFIRRVQKFIADVLIAEKEKRAKDKQVSKAVLGYDPDKWIRTGINIRSEVQNDINYKKLEMPPAIKGKHKDSYCQTLYEDVHRLMQQREWAYAHPEGSASGMTWTEMFILFDTAAHRTIEAQHVKDRETLRRATQRREKARTANGKMSGESNEEASGRQKWNINNTTVISKPTFGQEIKLFKAIARQVARHELNDEQIRIFQTEKGATCGGGGRWELKVMSLPSKPTARQPQKNNKPSLKRSCNKKWVPMPRVPNNTRSFSKQEREMMMNKTEHKKQLPCSLEGPG